MPPSSPLSRRDALALAACLGLVAAYWAPMLGWWFTATDTLALIAGARLSGAADGLRLLTEPMMAGTAFADAFHYWRPLTSLSFSLDHALWGLNPLGYHLTDLALHLGCVALASLLARRLAGGHPAAGPVAALAFGLHPALMDVVPAVARRQDPLCTLLWLGAWALALSGRRALATAALIGALMAKELAFALPALLLATAWVQGDEDSGQGARLGRALREGAPWLFTAGVALIARAAILGGVGGSATGARLPLGEIGAGFLRDLGAPSLLSFVAGLPGTWWLWAAGIAGLVAAGALLVTARRAIAQLGVEGGIPGALLTLGWGAAGLGAAAWGMDRLGIWAAVARAAGGLLDAVAQGGSQPAGVYMAALRDELLGPPLGAAVALGMIALCAAALRGRPRLAPALALAALGVALPLALYLATGVYEARLLYLPIAHLGILLGAATPGLEAWAGSLRGDAGEGATPARILGAMALIPLAFTLLAGPWLADRRHWAESARLSQEALSALVADADALPEAGRVVLVGLPSTVYALALAPGAPRSVSWPGSYAVTAWLAMSLPQRRLTAVVIPGTLGLSPAGLRLEETGRAPDEVVLQVRPMEEGR